VYALIHVFSQMYDIWWLRSRDENGDFPKELRLRFFAVFDEKEMVDAFCLGVGRGSLRSFLFTHMVVVEHKKQSWCIDMK
jgi:hypothetical protein